MADVDLSILGQKIGRWTILSRRWEPQGKRTFLLCRCDCGTEKEVERRSILDGRSTSCGCYCSEASTRYHKKHGEGDWRNGPISVEYRTWKGIRRRCNNPKDSNYSFYGGRGIKVSELWNDYTKFLEDVGRRPAPHLTIERINND